MHKGRVKKPQIKIFITKKTKRFRAIIKPIDGPEFEVTVGGKAWKEGKGREYEVIIQKKCEILLAHLQARLVIFNDNYLE